MDARRRTYYVAAFAALMTFGAYLPALRNGFVNWDDNVNVYDNPHIRSLDLSFFTWAFTDLSISYWQPVVWVSHAIDYTVWGLNPLGHHLTNNVLHALNTMLVVLLCQRLLQRANAISFAGSAGRAASRPERSWMIASVVAGLLFGLHPLHVESVAWISERKDLLSTLFFLASLLTYLSYTSYTACGDATKPFPKRLFQDRRYLLSLACFLLAIASKPMVVTLPAVLLLLDWYPLGRMRTLRSGAALLAEKTPFILLSAAGVVTAFIHKSGQTVVSLADAPLSDRLMESARTTITYLVKTIAPVHLSPYYPDPKSISFFSQLYLGSVTLAAGITLACIVFAGKRRMFAAAWAYFLITLLPVVGLVKTGSVVMADRFTYLPSIGPFLLAGAGAAWVYQTTEAQKKGITIAILATSAIILITGMTLVTWKQIAVWKNGVTFWSSLIDKEPTRVPFAYDSRGNAWKDRGELGRAIEDYTKAIELDPASAGAWNNRGITFQIMGKPDRSVADHTKAIALQPDNPGSYNSRGLAYKELGQIDRALEDFNTAIRLDPQYADAYISRGWTYQGLGRTDQAMEDYDHAIAIDPMRYVAYNDRGMVRQAQGSFDEAIADFSRALHINPYFAEAYVNRGLANEQAGRTDRALADYSAALRENPRFASAYNNRGLLYEREQRFEAALHDFNALISLDPSNGDAYNNRGLVYEDLGRYPEAIADYSRAIQLNPRDYLGFSNRGIAQAKAGRIAEAIEDQSQAIARKPDFAKAYFDRGNLYRLSGNMSRAAADFSAACGRGSREACEAVSALKRR